MAKPKLQKGIETGHQGVDAKMKSHQFVQGVFGGNVQIGRSQGTSRHCFFLATPSHAACIGANQASDALEEGGLATTVGPGKGQALTRFQDGIPRMKEPLSLVMFPYSTSFQNRSLGIYCWVGAHGPKSINLFKHASNHSCAGMSNKLKNAVP